MSNELTEITDRVLKEVIKNEVILPSTYKEHFENHAREMQIDLNYDKLVESIAQKRLNEANAMMEKTSCSLDTLEKTTSQAQEAIINKDSKQLEVVMNEIANLKEAIGSLRSELHTDSLTLIYNRKWLYENILHQGKFLFNGILIFIDIDKFKPINKKYGHIVGDKVLQYLAKYLKTSLKDMNIIRYAGDEFLAISEEGKMEECFMRVKTLQEELLSKKLKATNGDPLYLSFSFGITKFTQGAEFRDALEIADSLMYENKKHKRE